MAFICWNSVTTRLCKELWLIRRQYLLTHTKISNYKRMGILLSLWNHCVVAFDSTGSISPWSTAVRAGTCHCRARQRDRKIMCWRQCRREIAVPPSVPLNFSLFRVKFSYSANTQWSLPNPLQKGDCLDKNWSILLYWESWGVLNC